MNTIRSTWNQTPPAARWAIGLGGAALAGGALTLALGTKLLPGVNAMGYAGLGVGGGAVAVGVALKYRDQVGNPPLLSALVEKVGLRWKGIPVYKENVAWQDGSGALQNELSISACTTEVFSIDEIKNAGSPYVRGTFDDGSSYLILVLRCTSPNTNGSPRLRRGVEYTSLENDNLQLWILIEKEGKIHQQHLLKEPSTGEKYRILFPFPTFEDFQQALRDLTSKKVVTSECASKWKLNEQI